MRNTLLSLIIAIFLLNISAFAADVAGETVTGTVFEVDNTPAYNASITLHSTSLGGFSQWCNCSSVTVDYSSDTGEYSSSADNLVADYDCSLLSQGASCAAWTDPSIDYLWITADGYSVIDNITKNPDPKGNASSAYGLTWNYRTKSGTVYYGLNTTFPGTPPPIIDIVNYPISINEGQSLNVSFGAHDPNSSAVLRYSIYRNGTLVSSTNASSWLTNYTSAGTWNYTFFVNSTSGLNASETKMIIVNNTNRLPNITRVNYPVSVNEGEYLNVSFTANDSDVDDTLHYSIYRNGTLVSSTNASSWLTNYTSAGTWNYTFFVNDTYGASDVESRLIVVNNTNRLPNITSVNYPVSVNEGEYLNVSFTANDSDVDDTLYYSIYRNGTLVSSTNASSWLTNYISGGIWNYTFYVNDGHGGNDTEQRNVTINETILIYTEYDLYSPGINVDIITTFGPGVDVNLSIYNITGSNITDTLIYSTTGICNSAGNVTFTWDTSTAPYGNYTFIVYNRNKPTENATKLGIIIPPYGIQASGELYDYNLSFVNGTIYLKYTNGTVADVDDGNYSFELKYGVSYVFDTYPEFEKLNNIKIYGIANEGDTGDILGIDNPPKNYSFNELNRTFDEIFSYFPNVENYDYINITINHSLSSLFAVYKCGSWNFTDRTCPNENWTKIMYVNDGRNVTTVTLSKGDPGIGIGSTCGDNILDPTETCGNCPSDACPKISLSAPPNNSALNYPGINFTFNVSCLAPIQSCSVILNNRINKTSSDIITNQTNNIISNLTFGKYNWSINCTDNLGNTQKSTIYNLTLTDTVPPSWNPLPSNQLIEYGSSFSYDVNATDDFSLDKYKINDTITFSIDNNGLIRNNTGLAVGVYWLTISVNDTSNNINSTSISITVQDTTPPTWNQTPVDQVAYLGIAYQYDINASDLSGIDSYRINDTNNFAIDSISGIITNATGLSLGYYYLNISVNDTHNNVRSIVISIRVDVPDKSVPVISNRTSTTTTNSVTINWTTNKIANVTFNYGTNNSLGTIIIIPEYTVNHSISITNLTNFTLYYYNITMCNEYNNCSTNGNYNFVTQQNVPAGGGGGYRTRTITIGPEVLNCTEDWECSEWTVCSPGNTQNRLCFDLSACRKNEFKPAETKSCEYKEEKKEEKPTEVIPPARPEEPQAAPSNIFGLVMTLLAALLSIIFIIFILFLLKRRGKTKKIIVEMIKITPILSSPNLKEEFSDEVLLEAKKVIDELTKYVKSAIKNKLNNFEIEERLKNSGWPKEIINKLAENSIEPFDIASMLSIKITSALKEGLNNFEIRENLKASGWPEGIINKMLESK